MRPLNRFIVGCTAIALASQAATQSTPMFHNFAADMAMVQLQHQSLVRTLGEQAREGTPDEVQEAAVSRSAELTFKPSVQRRRANLAQFVARTRTDNHQSAAEMEQLFASTDVIGQFAVALAPYGYSTDNLADAYAFWWMTAWEGAQGSNRSFSAAEMQAVQRQAHSALLAGPRLARLNDAEKQQMAEAMWIQAAMIDGMVDTAKQQPDLMPRLQQSIRHGARASGLDLDALRLTAKGFIKR